MTAWASPEDFAQACPGESLAGEELTAALAAACAAVDAACFGRVERIGFDRLAPRQRALLVQAACRQAAWAARYGEAAESPLASYGINGVSMAFDPARMHRQGGALLGREVYGLLLQTGLAHRGIW